MHEQRATHDWKIALWMAISSTLGCLLLATSLLGDLAVWLDLPAHVAALDRQTTPQIAVFAGVALPSLACLAWFALYLSASRRPGPIGLTCTFTILAIATGGLSTVNGVTALEAAASGHAALPKPSIPPHPGGSKGSHKGNSKKTTTNTPASGSAANQSSSRPAIASGAQNAAATPHTGLVSSGYATRANAHGPVTPTESPPPATPNSIVESEQQTQSEESGGEQEQSQRQETTATTPGAATLSQIQTQSQTGGGSQSQSQAQSSTVSSE